MIQPALWLVLTGPLALAMAGLVPSATANRHADRFARLAFAAGSVAVASAAAATVALACAGTMRTATLGIAGAGLGLYCDALTCIVFVLVSFVGTIVIRFSRNYMDGDPGRGRFIKYLCLTLASVLVLIVSGNFLQFVLAWIATSVSLHQLLLFYRDRPAAVLAARKKFVASRIGDACLLVAMILLHRLFGSLDYAAMFAGAASWSGQPPAAAAWVAGLLAVAALLKSAQFPLHGWLLEVMETPTPVSALLHAGIINAGGFLLLRFAGIVALSPGALDLLILAGGFTALFGSVVMLTQTSVKVSLAWSTIAQMGFMMLQCGLGAFPSALLHLVAHSLYKAHAFLSSGSVIDLARAAWSPSAGGRPHPARLALAIGIVLVATVAAGTLAGARLHRDPGLFALGAIVLLGLTHLVVNALDERPNAYVIGRTLLAAAGVAGVWFTLQGAAAMALRGSVPFLEQSRGPWDLALTAAVVAAFAVLTVMQSVLPHRAGEPRWQAFYAHVHNGLYVNTIANRLVIKLWPAAAEGRGA